MPEVLKKVFLSIPTALGVLIAIAQSSNAQSLPTDTQSEQDVLEQLNRYSNTPNLPSNQPLGQVESVVQLRDVSPVANSTNNYGLQVNYHVSPNFNMGGYVGWVDAETEAGPDAEATLFNWAVNAAVPDFGKEGGVLLFVFGQPPKLVAAEGAAVEADPDTSYLLSVEYRYPLTDRINVASGGYAIFNPEHNNDSDTIYVGTARTIFSF